MVQSLGSDVEGFRWGTEHFRLFKLRTLEVQKILIVVLAQTFRALATTCNPDPLINKPPPLNRDYYRDPNTGLYKEGVY